MKLDKVQSEEVLFSAADIISNPGFKGKKKLVKVNGTETVVLKLPCTVTLDLPREDLSPNNLFTLNVIQKTPFAYRYIMRLDCSTQSPGMEVNDHYWSTGKMNCDENLTGSGEVIVPRVNLVPTGFPDGWKNISTLELSFSAYKPNRTIYLENIVLKKVKPPKGPRMTDEELFDAIDLRKKGMEQVKKYASKGNMKSAVSAFARYLRKRKLWKMAERTGSSRFPGDTAKDILKHRINQQQLGKDIDWHANPLGYLEWMHAFNRHFFMTILTDAYEVTGSEQYAQKLNYFIRTWMEQNPEPIGHNGGLDPAWETLSTACRMDWVWPYLFRTAQKSKAITDRTLVDLAKMVHAHADHLMKYPTGNNWLIAESTGMVTAAAIIPVFKRAKTWLEEGIIRLERELRNQVFKDGVQFELSPGYHSMCLTLFDQAAQRLAFTGHEVSKTYADSVKKMADYLTLITRPDGTYPVMNDAGSAMPRGNARLKEIGRKAKRDDWLWAGTGGEDGEPPKAGSVYFPDAGNAFMRSGWDKNDLWAFIDMGAFGAGHQHEDKLQVELYAYGTSFVVDPGISSYQRDPVVSYFRTSHAHNTVIIDGKSQCQKTAGDYKKFIESSRGKNLWVSGKYLDFAMGSYTGPYGNSDKDVRTDFVHTRGLVFVKSDYWIIIDEIAGKGIHEVEALWHFMPMHVRVDTKNSLVRTQQIAHANLELLCLGDWQKGKIKRTTAREKPVQGYIALNGDVRPITCIRFNRRKRLPLHGVTVAVPFHSGTGSRCSASTKSIQNGSSEGIVITVKKPDGSTDVALWRTKGRGKLTSKELSLSGVFGLVRYSPQGKAVSVSAVDGTVKVDKVSVTSKSGAMKEMRV